MSQEIEAIKARSEKLARFMLAHMEKSRGGFDTWAENLMTWPERELSAMADAILQAFPSLDAPEAAPQMTELRGVNGKWCGSAWCRKYGCINLHHRPTPQPHHCIATQPWPTPISDKPPTEAEHKMEN